MTEQPKPTEEELVQAIEWFHANDVPAERWEGSIIVHTESFSFQISDREIIERADRRRLELEEDAEHESISLL